MSVNVINLRALVKDSIKSYLYSMKPPDRSHSTTKPGNFLLTRNSRYVRSRDQGCLGRSKNHPVFLVQARCPYKDCLWKTM